MTAIPMETIPDELDWVRAEIEGMYGIREHRGLTSEEVARYDSLLATETRLLAQSGVSPRS